jgi:hypothetical protein
LSISIGVRSWYGASGPVRENAVVGTREAAIRSGTYARSRRGARAPQAWEGRPGSGGDGALPCGGDLKPQPGPGLDGPQVRLREPLPAQRLLI